MLDISTYIYTCVYIYYYIIIIINLIILVNFVTPLYYNRLFVGDNYYYIIFIKCFI